MTNVIKIGKPAGYDRAVRLMTKEEVTIRDRVEREAQLAADMTRSMFQMRQVIRHMQRVHGDGATKCALLQIAGEFWPE